MSNPSHPVDHRTYQTQQRPTSEQYVLVDGRELCSPAVDVNNA